MSQRKLIVLVIVLVAVAAVLWWQYSINETLRRNNETLRSSIGELRRLQQVHEPVTNGESPTPEQLDELAKLRSEAARLREQTNQIGTLVEANQKLAVSLNAARTPPQAVVSKKINPDDALPQDIHPKDSWAFRGYATPDATIESTLWAMMKGDKETALKGFSPEMQPKMEKRWEGQDFGGEMKNVNMAEFRVVDRQQLSPDEMVLTVYTARQDENGDKVKDSQAQTVFDRIDGEWKVTEKKPPSDN